MSLQTDIGFIGFLSCCVFLGNSHLFSSHDVFCRYSDHVFQVFVSFFSVSETTLTMNSHEQKGVPEIPVPDCNVGRLISILL